MEEGIIVEQPDTLEERIGIAESFIADAGISIPVLIDGIDNAVARDYKAWPDRLYVVGKDGKVFFKGDPGPWGFKPMEVIPDVFNTMTGVDSRKGMAVTWGSLKMQP